MAAEGTSDELVARVSSELEFTADKAPAVERATVLSDGSKHLISTDDLVGDAWKVLS